MARQRGPTNGVDALYINSGFFQVKGIDAELHSTWDLGNGWGSLDVSDQLAWVDSWEQQELPGTPAESCEGLYGESCETPLPEYRNRFSTTWITPWNVTLNVSWRYVDGVDMVPGADDPVDIESNNYFDLAAIWNVTDFATLRAGVNNLLDTAPPITDNGITATQQRQHVSGRVRRAGPVLVPRGELPYVRITGQRLLPRSGKGRRSPAFFSCIIRTPARVRTAAPWIEVRT